MLEIIDKGIFTTIQDNGRNQLRDAGIPVGGAMDGHAFRLANHLLGNPENEAAIEFMYKGPTIKFHRATTITLTGADFNPKLNDQSIRNGTRVKVKPGDVLQTGSTRDGVYGYLGVSGGFLLSPKFNSRSYYPEICNDSLLKNGRKVHYFGRLISSNQHAKVGRYSPKYEKNALDVYKGPEFKNLPAEQQQILTEKEFKISSSSNRMSVQLEHDYNLGIKDILTAPVQPGVVQLTPAGKLIVLMQDAQTTGGYARVFILSEEAQHILAQKRPHSNVKFNSVN